MVKYRLQVIGRYYNYNFTKEYDENSVYTDLEMITQILNENKNTLKDNIVYTIIFWRY